jgi:GT2 family glycosyltransferase
MPLPRLGVIIVTMGNRPAELAKLLSSVEQQDVPATKVVLIGNATPLTDVDVPDNVTKVPLEENLGCPGGRNVGLDLLRDEVDVIIDLDDDGLLIANDVFRRIQRRFAADPELGILAFRIADEHGHTERRWVPRLRSDDPMHGGPVTAFLGGGHAFSVPMLKRIGDWAAQFFFGHEETDLAWRALDDGWTIHYDPDLVLQHPRTSPARHATHYRYTARNRVWLARRRLPRPLIPLYLGVWTLLTLARIRSATAAKAWLGGFWEGTRTPCGPRKAMRWRTVWKMTRLGRPPLI